MHPGRLAYNSVSNSTLNSDHLEQSRYRIIVWGSSSDLFMPYTCTQVYESVVLIDPKEHVDMMNLDFRLRSYTALLLTMSSLVSNVGIGRSSI